MTYHRSKWLEFGMILVFLSGWMGFGFAREAGAAPSDPKIQHYRQDREAPVSQDRPHAGQVQPRTGQAHPPVMQPQPRAGQAPPPVMQPQPRTGQAPPPAKQLQPRPVRIQVRQYTDSRYQHNRQYPVRGNYVQRLPGGNRVVIHGGKRYYYYGGVWYRPYGTRFTVIAPPFGLVVPFLPTYYATVWYGGIPYYYANEVYYRPGAGGYVVVEPPQGEASEAPPPAAPVHSGQIFIYPREGQSEQQQATDRFECHSWAVSQTGYDPTRPQSEMPDDQKIQMSSDYERAMGACLDGRGYTVK